MITQNYDFEIDVFYEGEYYPVTADLFETGVCSYIDDWVEIEVEPEFSYLTIYDPDTLEPISMYHNPQKYVEDNPEDKLARLALEFLREIFWERELNYV